MSLSPPDPVPPEFRAWDRLRRPVWLFDPRALRGVYANLAALKLWGSESLDELLSRDFSRLSPAVRARTERLARETAGGAELSEQWTFYPNGAPVTVQATISTLTMPDGRGVLMFEAAPTEVEPEERRAVEALRHTATLISLFDDSGRPVFANPAAFAAYGASDHPFAARFANPDLGPAMLAEALGGTGVAEVHEAITLQGRRWHHFQARPVTDPVTGVVGVLLDERDVTERVEAEQARAAAEQRMAMAEASQRFMTEMSHELRTPLNAVMGFSEILKDGDLPERARGQARHIHEAGARLLEVVNQMIEHADLQSSDGVETVSLTGEPDAPSRPAAPVADEERPARVLYVEDNEVNRALVSAILTAQGAYCETANDGAEGLEAARSGDWDVILMDIRMPVMDGLEATRAIRRLPGRAGLTPIVALTANTLDEQILAYRLAGMDDCIAKPINVTALIGTVSAWCGVHHGQSDLARPA